MARDPNTPAHALLTVRTLDEVPENALLIAACVKGEWVELWRIVGVTVEKPPSP